MADTDQDLIYVRERRLPYETFDSDPGWEGVNNRVAAADGPVVGQDFGYRPIGEPGYRGVEIGHGPRV